MKRKSKMKKLTVHLGKKSGRGVTGRITVRHQGGRRKRRLRIIDFGRSNNRDVPARVEAIEYDPNRNADVALLCFENGDWSYIIAPLGLKVGVKLVASELAPIEPGNALPLNKIPIGTQIHNIEIKPGKGGQIVRGAGSAAVIHGREKDYISVKLPSGEIKRFKPGCFATIGQVGKAELRSERIGKAGRKRRMGIRPTVRGTAQHPGAHPHGGGEGRSGVGMKHPKTPYGKPAVGKTRKRKKYSDKLIIKKRKPGKHSH
ncbi:50S ribosomal protein L2 [Patescibacteria group bacterium]